MNKKMKGITVYNYKKIAKITLMMQNLKKLKTILSFNLMERLYRNEYCCLVKVLG
jgi:hypothetical protein